MEYILSFDWIGKINWGKLVLILVCIAIGVAAWLVIGFQLKKLSKKRAKGKKKITVTKVFYRIARTVIVILMLVFILQICGVNVTATLAGLGLAGAIVGLAVQDFLKDIFMGTHILADDFYSIGDVVEYKGEEGIVKEFNLKTTKIELLTDHSVISISNRDVSSVKKFSGIVNLYVPLSYDLPIADVEKLFDTICIDIGKIEGIKICHFAGTESFNDSSISYKLQFECEPKLRKTLKHLAYMTIQKTLEKESINIPFNQLDVHFDKDAD